MEILTNKERLECKYKNPICSEILIRLNFRKVYLSEFYKEFKTQEGKPKTRTPIYHHIESMLKKNNPEQYFIKKSHTEGKKQFYEIDWQGLLDDYFRYLKRINPKFKIKSEWKDATKNKLLAEIFSSLFIGQSRATKQDKTLEQIYHLLTHSRLDLELIGLDETKQEMRILKDCFTQIRYNVVQGSILHAYLFDLIDEVYKKDYMPYRNLTITELKNKKKGQHQHFNISQIEEIKK